MGSKKILGQKNFWVEKNFKSERILGPKKFESENKFGPKNIEPQKIWEQKKCAPKNILCPKKKFRVQKNVWVPKHYGLTKNLWSKNFRCEKIVLKNLGKTIMSPKK